MEVCLVVRACVPVIRLVVFNSCDPSECSPPGSSVLGIFPARILEQVAISSSRGSSWPRGWTHISCIGRRLLYNWATQESQLSLFNYKEIA